MFCVIQSSTLNSVFFNRFINARYNGVFNIGSLIAIINPAPIEYYMNGVPIIVSDEQSILMLPMNHSPIPMHNHLEANESKCSVIQHSRIQFLRILLLDKNEVGNDVIVKMSYLIAINRVDALA